MARLTTFVVVGLLAAGAEASTAQADRDAREVGDYRLSMEVVRKIAAVNKALAAAAAKDPREQEIARKKAELAALEEKEQPTEAELQRIDALVDEIERLERGADDEPEPDAAESLSEMARRVEAVPVAAAALRTAGLSAREYATALLALMQAGLAHALTRSNPTQQPPDGVSKHNLDFVREHEKEIEALGAVHKRDAGGR